MNKSFEEIFESIPLTPCNGRPALSRHINSVNLIDKFTFALTIEGHDFWAYVNKRLHQISEGIGYKNVNDTKK